MTTSKRERIAGHIGSASTFLNGWCIGGAIGQLLVGNLRASAIYGIVGSLLGVVMHRAAVIEWHAFMNSAMDDLGAIAKRVRA